MSFLTLAFSLALTLLTQPTFWYCVVALICANIVADGIGRGLRAHAVVMRRPRHELDDESGSVDASELPRWGDVVPTSLDERAFDRTASGRE